MVDLDDVAVVAPEVPAMLRRELRTPGATEFLGGHALAKEVFFHEAIGHALGNYGAFEAI